MENQEQIQALLAQKAAATPDQARRIRRQLRAMGYRLSEQGKPEGDQPKATVAGTSVKKARKARSTGEYPDMTGKKLMIPPVMSEEAIDKLTEAFQETFDLTMRSTESLSDAEYGYGFDLSGSLSPQSIMTKFQERWPSTEAEWFMLLGEPGTIRILLVGPVTPSMGARA
jgi:hypothetical protein